MCVYQECQERNWLELPSDLTVTILQRVGVVGILQSVQKVCTAWRKICKDPSIWTVVYMNRSHHEKVPWQEMCKHAVDQSQGQLLDLTITAICDTELIQYVADRSIQLRRLEIVYYFGQILSEALMRLPLLEELSLIGLNMRKEDIEAVGHYCPMLKTLKVHRRLFISAGVNEDNEIAISIGKYLPELTHLELIGSSMSNIGLQAILDGCCHLESLDLSGWLNLDLNADLVKRCSQQIRNLKLPHCFRLFVKT